MHATLAVFRWLLSLFIAVVVGVSASGARADTLTNVNDTIYLPGPAFNATLTGSFQYDFGFTLAQSRGVFGSFSWFDSQDVYASNIENFSASLRSADGLTVFATTGAPIGTDIKSSSFLVGNLAAGNYLVRVSGGANSADGLFEGSLTAVAAQTLAAPVPEPGGWVMLAAGLCLIGATMRRRAPRSSR